MKIKKEKKSLYFKLAMNNLLLRASRIRAQSRLYESSCLAHRLVTVHEEALISAITNCETLDGLTALTDNLEKLVRNPTELFVQFPFLLSKLFAIPLSSSASATIVTNENTANVSGEDDSIYEFMSLYDSEEGVVDGNHLKDASDTILDELAAANVFLAEEDIYEPESCHHRPHLPIIETNLTTEHDEPKDGTTDLLMKGFIVTDTSVTKRKNKSPRNGDGSRTSPGKCDGEKKRGRPAVSPCDKKPKVKKTNVSKNEVKEPSADNCYEEELDK
jgi:hypothetical protein